MRYRSTVERLEAVYAELDDMIQPLADRDDFWNPSGPPMNKRERALLEKLGDARLAAGYAMDAARKMLVAEESARLRGVA